MTKEKRYDLTEALIKVIIGYSPEYFDLSPESANKLYSLLDSIQEFEEEAEKQALEEKEKYDSLKK